ncbi:MAG: SDR family NAD(P)-dependent oxidoreductase [Coleofasciculaceae cyanobacterium]
MQESTGHKNQVKKVTSKSICLTWEDMELFRAASHDVNPLHCSEEYARKTPFIRRVGYGILGTIACLGHLQQRTGFVLSKIKIQFSRAVYPQIDYQVEIVDDFPQQATIKLYDGQKLLLKLIAHFQTGKSRILEENVAWKSPLREPVHLKASDLNKDDTVEGEYAVELAKMRSLIQRFNLSEKGIAEIQLVALLWSSYLVGMELPGRQALFSELSLDFEPLLESNDPQLSYTAKVTSFNPKFGMINSQVELMCQKTLLATGKTLAMVRPEPCLTSLANIKTLLPPSEALKDKVALVTGASRGLGATIAQFLALQGCTVLANFHKSRAEAEQLQASLTDASGKVVLYQGNTGNLDWCKSARKQIIKDYGKLDFLFCNACPGIVPLWLEDNAIERINDYVSQSLALVSVPMATFLHPLSETSGWNIIISSIFTIEAPTEWPHYVAAKHAVEGLTKVASSQYKNVNFMLVRPPLLLTDLSNTPMAQLKARLPEEMAAQIVKSLLNESVDSQGSKFVTLS